MPDKHALLSVSGSNIWLHCPPSVRAGEGFPDTGSDAAAEGTRAHDLCEKKLKSWLKTGKRTAFKAENPTMSESTDGYRDYVIQIFNELKAAGQNPILKVEVTLDLTEWIPEGFGTSDALIISGGTLHVVDFKYGQQEVNAPGNSQIRIYALGAVHLYREIFEFEQVKTHIYQPRLDHISTEEISVEELLAWGETIKPIAQMAFDGSGERKAGKWCQFCRCSHRCKARADTMFKVLEPQPDPQTMTNAEIAAYLPLLDDAVKWANSLKEYAQAQALEGEKFPGWKLVEGRSVRSITDQEKLAEAMTAKGYTEDQIWKPKALQTLTALEKAVGKKKFATDYAEFIYKPKGKPVLVPESDKRTEYQSAEDMFGKPEGE